MQALLKIKERHSTGNVSTKQMEQSNQLPYTYLYVKTLN